MYRFWLKSHYFVAYAILGAYVPYMALHAKDIGLTDQQLGILLGLGALSAIVTPPLLTFFADTILSNRSLLGLSYALAGVFLSVMALTDDTLIFSIAYVIYAISYGGTIPILDGLTFAMFEDLTDQGREHQPYHFYRIWGSIGFIAPAAIVAGIIYFTHTNRDAFLFGVFLALVGLFTVPMLPKPEHRVKLPLRNAPTLKAAKILLHPQLLAFIIPMLMVTMASTTLYAFYPQHLKNLGVPKQWVGLAMSIGVIVEIPFVLYSGWFIKRLGTRGVMLLGTGCMVIRYALLGFCPILWIALLTQFCHGPIVLAMYIIPQTYINRKADKDCRNSIQGLYVMICSGLGRLVGSSLAGYYADIELTYSFIYSTILAVGATTLIFVFFRDHQADEAIQQRVEQTVEVDYEEIS